MAAKVKFHTIKPEMRILGIDYCPSASRRSETAILIGIVFRGGFWLDGVMKTKVEMGGLDATEKIGNMIKTSPHYGQIRIIMLDGKVLKDINCDVRTLFELTKLPVIALVRGKKMEDIKNAVRNLPNFAERWKTIQNSGESVKMKLNGKNVKFLISGIAKEDAEKIVRMSCTRSNIPEPIRVARVIALGLAKPRND